MPLLLDLGRPVDDPWASVEDGAETVPDGPAIVSLERWRRDRDALERRNAPLGIRLKSSQLASEIAADLGRFAVVALEFPKFRDGRAFSTARTLRERHGYQGEIRAVGHTIADQYLFLLRTGFSSVEVPDDANLATWRHALAEVSVAYQHVLASDHPLSQLRRRIAADPEAPAA